MGNSEYKRIRAKNHNMLRVENQAYAEDKDRFPKKIVKSSEAYRKNKGISKAAIISIFGAL
jgi:hypothetical protein